MRAIVRERYLCCSSCETDRGGQSEDQVLISINIKGIGSFA